MADKLYYTFAPLLGRSYTIASTEKGLAYVAPDDGVLDPLAYYFNGYELIESDVANQRARQQLQEYVDGQHDQFDLDLDLAHGTPFQQSVWHSLLAVPYGQTTTYGDIANSIDNPKAIRAVGGAIGRNPISIIVPCHRIIGKSGKLTGYSGGLDIKEKLLKIEKVL